MIRSRPGRPHYRGKRLFDLIVVALLAVPAVLVAVPVTAAVSATSRGPVLFRQERVGRDGRRFVLLKFRTMVDDDNPVFPDPTRVTAVGRILRKLSLDELPQLINVARGEMSIVGPRPTLAYQVERYTPRQLGRLAVNPGITGAAQLEGRNAMPWAERIEIDLHYIGDQSWWTDAALIARTFAPVARGSDIDGHPADDPLARPENDSLVATP